MPQTGSILVIGPDRTIETLVVDLLTDAGYSATTVNDRSDALAVAVMVAPALIVLGIGHSIAPSARLIKQMRAAGLIETRVVVMTTNMLAAAPLMDALSVVACIAQPFDLDDVLACVGRYVPLQTVELAARTVGAPESYAHG